MLPQRVAQITASGPRKITQILLVDWLVKPHFMAKCLDISPPEARISSEEHDRGITAKKCQSEY